MPVNPLDPRVLAEVEDRAFERMVRHLLLLRAYARAFGHPVPARYLWGLTWAELEARVAWALLNGEPDPQFAAYRPDPLSVCEVPH